jgi:cysteine peptidase C11 family protein
MPDNTENIKEWTLMFYFASDNPLAPGIISQLKAIKAAGFHKEANVIAQFDPYTEGTPTHVFDINIIKKLENPEDCCLGFDTEDPLACNLVEDKLWRDERDRNGNLMRDSIRNTVGEYAPGVPPAWTIQSNGQRYELNPLVSLEEFLRFCSSRYPAKHYMLFILGHGVVVGNDIFLFDEHADQQSLSLTGLRRVLENFTLDIKSHYGTFELVSFHSCSVSSIEVAHELRNTAKYMLASQGATFVGSWPYREILLRIFKDLKRFKRKLSTAQIRDMFIRIFTYCLQNSTDFLLAGYPFDLCLCDLNKVKAVKPELNKLAAALKTGLDTCQGRESIQMAHLEAQSFYGEMYTDLLDFCRCLYLRTNPATAPAKPEMPAASTVDTSALALAGEPAGESIYEGVPALNANAAVVPTAATGQTNGKLAGVDPTRTIPLACERVIKTLRNTIVKRGFAGPEYQYSRGLSIYFPWSRPSDDSGILANYAHYQIAETGENEPPGPTWLDFLNGYFEKTRRTRAIFEEVPQRALAEAEPEDLKEEDKLQEDKIALVYMTGGSGSTAGFAGSLQKTDKTDPMGGDCSCPSIKNYPRDTRRRRERNRPFVQEPDLGPAFFRQESQTTAE